VLVLGSDKKKAAFLNHLGPLEIATFCPEGKSVAYLSAGKPTHLVLFVHGFSGRATETWANFHILLPKVLANRDCDLLFYEYDGKYSTISKSAIQLRDFLLALGADPAWANPFLPKSYKPARREYQKVIMVAHSMGAVVVRRALLELHNIHVADSSKAAWLKTVSLVLFAPAHMGARAAELAKELMSSFDMGGAIASIVKYRVPAIRELDPESKTLRLLKEDTLAALKSSPHNAHLVAKTVVWAVNDRVVENDRFCADPTGVAAHGFGHIDVCKPRLSSDQAVTVILSEL
jgi:pimeloyl-ACP methyl ester carboxylesterase